MIVAQPKYEEKIEANSWKWQLTNKITTVEQLEKYINLDETSKVEIKRVLTEQPMSITPYYASLMDPNDPDCPIRKQVIPSIAEIANSEGTEDPLSEERDSPVSSIIQRYPDRLAFYVANPSQCPSRCRFCSRKRRIGKEKQHTSQKAIEEGLQYLREHDEIRDVLITGGDALMLSDSRLEYILSQVRNIKHVEIIRIGTRLPVTIPQRITQDLCDMLQEYHPIWLNTHFNHPKEITEESAEACDMLSRVGIPIGNQTVLLKGINDSPAIMKKLMHELLRIRVRPYYIFQCYPIKGIEHFRTSIATGIEIMENLRGHTSGLAVPTYIVNAPGGGGKVPIAPTYILSMTDTEMILRNYKMEVFRYQNGK